VKRSREELDIKVDSFPKRRNCKEKRRKLKKGNLCYVLYVDRSEFPFICGVMKLKCKSVENVFSHFNNALKYQALVLSRLFESKKCSDLL